MLFRSVINSMTYPVGWFWGTTNPFPLINPIHTAISHIWLYPICQPIAKWTIPHTIKTLRVTHPNSYPKNSKKMETYFNKKTICICTTFGNSLLNIWFFSLKFVKCLSFTRFCLKAQTNDLDCFINNLDHFWK